MKIKKAAWEILNCSKAFGTFSDQPTPAMAEKHLLVEPKTNKLMCRVARALQLHQLAIVVHHRNEESKKRRIDLQYEN